MACIPKRFLVGKYITALAQSFETGSNKRPKTAWIELHVEEQGHAITKGVISLGLVKRATNIVEL